MVTNYENTAGRLLNIFRAAVAIPNNKSKRHAWALVFGCDPSDTPDIYKNLTKCHLALDEIERQIELAKPEYVEICTREFPSIRKALAPPNLDGMFDEATTHLNQGVLTVLEICAVNLPKDGKVSDSDLEKISSHINQLFVSIFATEMDQDLRDLLLKLVSQMRRSIDDFRIKGAEGMDFTLSYLWGELGRNKDLLQKHKDVEELKDVESLFARFSSFVAIARAYVGLGHSTVDAINETQELIERGKDLLS